MKNFRGGPRRAPSLFCSLGTVLLTAAEGLKVQLQPFRLLRDRNNWASSASTMVSLTSSFNLSTTGAPGPVNSSAEWSPASIGGRAQLDTSSQTGKQLPFAQHVSRTRQSDRNNRHTEHRRNNGVLERNHPNDHQASASLQENRDGGLPESPSHRDQRLLHSLSIDRDDARTSRESLSPAAVTWPWREEDISGALDAKSGGQNGTIHCALMIGRKDDQGLRNALRS